MNTGLIYDRKTHFPLQSLAPASYVTPAHIDRRPEMLTASNQGTTPHCAGFAMAGWLEYYNWKHKGIAEQIDGHAIYARAKKVDGHSNSDGTSLDAAFQAAQDLGLLSSVDAGSVREVANPGEVQQAIHRYGVVLSAFQITDRWAFAKPEGWIPSGGQYVGYHAVVLCGYSMIEAEPWYAIQNSWGEGSGWRGFNRLHPDAFDDQFRYGLVWDVNK